MSFRRALATTAVTASLLGAVALTAPAAQAAPLPGFWSERGTYNSYGECFQAGQGWVARGVTAVFRCDGLPNGPHQLLIWLA